jgi:hypothetical protein
MSYGSSYGMYDHAPVMHAASDPVRLVPLLQGIRLILPLAVPTRGVFYVRSTFDRFGASKPPSDWSRYASLPSGTRSRG